MVISDQHPNVNVEPYFYGHPLSELGFSMEAAVCNPIYHKVFSNND